MHNINDFKEYYIYSFYFKNTLYTNPKTWKGNAYFIAHMIITFEGYSWKMKVGSVNIPNYFLTIKNKLWYIV